MTLLSLDIAVNQWRSQPDNLVMLCKFSKVYRLEKESISKEMNNDNDLNLHSMTNYIVGLASLLLSTLPYIFAKYHSVAFK